MHATLVRGRPTPAAMTRTTRTARARQPRASPRVTSMSAFWTLHQVNQKDDPRASIDLTGCLGQNRSCSIGSKDYSGSLNDFTIVDHGGVHLLFEEQGYHNHKLDSDSVLYMTDVDSMNDVYLDGVLVPRGSKVACRPGAVVTLEGGISFVVERNLVAHA
jgi:hypothetical protein